MNYSVRTKEKWHALPICGSDEFLTTCEEIKSMRVLNGFGSIFIPEIF